MLFAVRLASGDLRNFLDGADDISDDRGDQVLILTLRHDPDHWLGPGRADEQAARRAEPLAPGLDRRQDATVLHRRAVGDPVVPRRSGWGQMQM